MSEPLTDAHRELLRWLAEMLVDEADAIVSDPTDPTATDASRDLRPILDRETVRSVHG